MTRRNQTGRRHNNPTRDAQATATRADLLFQARKLFVAHGYETVTTRQIAQAAGKSTGAVFAHWSGKDELFAEAMGRPPITDARGWQMMLALAFWGYLNAGEGFESSEAECLADLCKPLKYCSAP